MKTEDRMDEGQDDVMDWSRVSPPLWWPKAGMHVIGDRHLPNGTRQHLVEGRVAPGLVISNAEVIGCDEVRAVRFADVPSHLSEPSPA